MKTEKINFGCNVRDIDAKAVTPAEFAELKDHLYRNRLIVLKDQSLSEQQYCDFANRFGFPVPYLQDNYHHPEYPLIFVSSNVKSDGKQIGVAMHSQCPLWVESRQTAPGQNRPFVRSCPKADKRGRGWIVR